MSDDEKQNRLKNVTSEKEILYTYTLALRNQIAGLELRLKMEKINYMKKLIKNKILDLYAELDDYAHKYSLILIKEDLLDYDIGLTL